MTFALYVIEARVEVVLDYLSMKNKFGYNNLQDIPISPAWYLNQRLLKFN